MEVAPASAPSAAPAAAPAAPSSAEHTASAQASTPPATTVNANGTPGTSTPPASASTGNWMDSFDADTKDYVTQKGFKDPKAILESYRNLEKLRGVPQERLLKLPEAGDAKGMGEVFEKLGKPATPEGYGLQPKDANKAAEVQEIASKLHSLNLTKDQAIELVKWDQEREANRQASENEAHTAAVQTQTINLKKEWGAAFNQNVARAQAAYRQLGIPDTAIDSLERSIGFDGVMKLFNNLGSRVGEHEFISGDGRQQFGEGALFTPEQAKARIKALKQDNGWVQKYLAKDVQAMAEMERLMKMANPTD